MEQKKIQKINLFNLVFESNTPVVLTQSNNIYTKFLGCLIKRGNKVAAKTLLESLTVILFKNFKKKVFSSFFKGLFIKLDTFVEVKKIKIRRKAHTIPFPIVLNRRYFLIVNWLIQSVKMDKTNVSFTQKLSREVSNVLTKGKSTPVSFKRQNDSQAFLNRSNSNFRW